MTESFKAHGVTRSFEDGKLHKGDIVKIKGILGEFKVQWIDEFEDLVDVLSEVCTSSETIRFEYRFG